MVYRWLCGGRKNICRAVVFGFLILAAAFGHAAAGNRPVLYVGFVPSPGFLDAVPETPSAYRGYGHSIMQFVCANAGLEAVYVPGTWDECVARLRSGEIDTLLEMPGDAAALPDIARSKWPIGLNYGQLVLAGDYWNSARERQRFRLGYVRNTAPTPLSVEKHFPAGYAVIQFANHAGAQEALTHGQIDGYLDMAMHRAVDDRPRYLLSPRPMYFLVRADRTQLKQQLDDAFEQFLLVSPMFQASVFNYFYLANGNGMKPEYTREEREYLEKHRRLRVVATPGQPPFTYFSGGKHRGIVANVMNMLAEDMGVEIETIPTDNITESLNKVGDGEVDVISDVNSSSEWAHRNHILITQPYLRLDYCMVTRRFDPGTAQPIVAAPRGHYYTKHFVERRHPAAQIIYCDSVADCLEAVAKRRADATYIKTVTANQMIVDGSFYSLRAQPIVSFSHDVSLGINENADGMLFRILNKAVARLDQSRIRRNIYEELDKADYENKWMSLAYTYPTQTAAAIVVFLIVVSGMGLVIYQLKRQRLAAYHDIMSGLHNRHWLAQLLSGGEGRRLEPMIHSGGLYLATIGVSALAEVLAAVGRASLARYLADLAARVADECPWVLHIAAGTDAGRLYLVCKFPAEADHMELIREIIERNDLVPMPNGGICPRLKGAIVKIKAADTGSATMQTALKALDAAYFSIIDSPYAVRIFDDLLARQLDMRQKIEASFKDALDAGEFLVYYQPKYHLQTHKIDGAEALVRWQSSKLGFMTPGTFLPVLEQDGSIRQLDRYIIDSVARFQRLRLDDGKPIVPISINQDISFFEEQDYVDFMLLTFRQNHLPIGALHLELKDRDLADVKLLPKQTRFVDVCRQLYEVGYRFDIDDYTGACAHFTLLESFLFDTIKPDRSILRQAEVSAKAQAMLEAIITMGKRLRLTIIGEGVETLGQEKLLLALGCVHGQGFLNAQPMPEEDFEQVLETQNRQNDGDM